uniref:Uncharacterized protein n=1 Tax=Rhizophora mucronata TaxID=61149 RepID=A0A2P2LXI1_RHIMU
MIKLKHNFAPIFAYQHLLFMQCFRFSKGE